MRTNTTSNQPAHVRTADDPRSKKPPAWFVHLAWRVHRTLHRMSGGRFLWTTDNRRGWGAMQLTTIGRRSARARSVIIGYLEDGPHLVALAMNGWDEGHPAWWLNLVADPDASVRLAGQQPRPVRAREATGDERARLWQRWLETDPDLLAPARDRATTTPVVVLEPRRSLIGRPGPSGHAPTTAGSAPPTTLGGLETE